MVAIDEAIVAEKGGVDLHAVEASESLFIDAVGDALRTERTAGGIGDWIFPVHEEKALFALFVVEYEWIDEHFAEMLQKVTCSRAGLLDYWNKMREKLLIWVTGK